MIDYKFIREQLPAVYYYAQETLLWEHNEGKHKNLRGCIYCDEENHDQHDTLVWDCAYCQHKQQSIQTRVYEY